MGKKKAPNGAFWAGGVELSRHHAHFLSLSIKPSVKHQSIDFSKKGVIPTHTNIFSRVNARTTLTHDDIAGTNLLASIDLYPSPLPLTVSTVS